MSEGAWKPRAWLNYKLGLELLRHSDKPGHFRSAQADASSLDLFFLKLCKSNAKSNFLNFLLLPWLPRIHTKTSTYTHTPSEKFQLQRTTKSPLRRLKVLETLEPGSFHKLGLELLPRSAKAQHLRSTQQDASSFNPFFQQSANQIARHSSFPPIHPPSTNTFKLLTATPSRALFCFPFLPVRPQDRLKSVLEHYDTTVLTCWHFFAKFEAPGQKSGIVRWRRCVARD